jgi:hypothetical protein
MFHNKIDLFFTLTIIKIMSPIKNFANSFTLTSGVVIGLYIGNYIGCKTFVNLNYYYPIVNLQKLLDKFKDDIRKDES